jgi:hypothetical protein
MRGGACPGVCWMIIGRREAIMRRTLFGRVTGLSSVRGIAAIAIFLAGIAPERVVAHNRTSAFTSEATAEIITLSCAEQGRDEKVELITIDPRNKVVRMEFPAKKVVLQYRDGEYRSILPNSVNKEHQFVAVTDDFITWGGKSDKGEITKLMLNRKTDILSGLLSSSLLCSVRQPFRARGQP